MLKVLIGPPDTWSPVEDSIEDMKIAYLEIVLQWKDFSIWLSKDALLALQMSQ